MNFAVKGTILKHNDLDYKRSRESEKVANR